VHDHRRTSVRFLRNRFLERYAAEVGDTETLRSALCPAVVEDALATLSFDV
jgi:hypothetical protein